MSGKTMLVILVFLLILSGIGMLSKMELENEKNAVNAEEYVLMVQKQLARDVIVLQVTPTGDGFYMSDRVYSDALVAIAAIGE